MHNFLSIILINYLGDFQFRQQVYIIFFTPTYEKILIFTNNTLHSVVNNFLATGIEEYCLHTRGET